MELEAFINELGLTSHMLALALGLPRLIGVFQTVPFMAGTIITGQMRMTLAIACYLPLHPVVMAGLPGTSTDSSWWLLCGLLVFKEILIGVLLGFLAGMLFWAVQCAGFFIDNQRGASQAEETDPLTGEQTSPLGSFLFQCAAYMFFSGGAFLAFLGVLYASYELWPVTVLLPLQVLSDIRLPLFFVGQVDWLLRTMLLLAAPIAAACLLTDLSLGLISRSAPQLNVYVLAMPVKSAVAMFLLVLYFGLALSGIADLFWVFGADVEQLRTFIKGTS